MPSHRLAPARRLGLLLVGGTLLLAAPAAARSETAPASPAPAATPAAPSGPAAALPAGLVGEWFDGELSSVQAYDPVTGQWGSPNGTALFLIVRADTSYIEGGVLSSTAYSCTIDLQVATTGTLRAEGDRLVLAQTGGQTVMTNTCGSDAVYPAEVKEIAYGFALGRDDEGRETLALTNADGTPYVTYRRWVH